MLHIYILQYNNYKKKMLIIIAKTFDSINLTKNVERVLVQLLLELHNKIQL
jgi:hypothetical protein